MLSQQRNGTKRCSDDIGDESIDFSESVVSQFDPMDSETNIQEIQCLGHASINKGTYENVVNCDDDYNLVIDNKGLDTNRIKECMLEGRRIVDISFMWNEIHRTFDNHARGIQCQFKDWKMINSRRRGLLTQLFF